MFSIMSMLTTTNAKSLQEIWKSRPSGLLNELEKKTEFKVDTTTCDFMSITLTTVSDIQIKRIPTEASDSIICVVHTYYGPAKESTICLFTQDWKSIGNFSFPPAEFFKQSSGSIGNMPETDSLEIDTYLLSAKLSPTDNSLTMNIDFPFNSPEEIEVLSKLYKSKTLIWNGKTFK